MKTNKRELKFYSPEEEKELRKVLAENIDVKIYANTYAEAYGRTPASLLAKLKSLKNSKQESKFTHQQETILKHCLFRGDNKAATASKYAKEWNMSTQAVNVKLNWLAGNITKSVAEEQEGVLFEGTPTKVVLFSDHFRVYF